MVLRTEHLYKTYGKRTVVNDVSIEVHQGEIVGLLGPNGAGKTTTFYMTTGLVTPNEGKIFLNDEEITHFPVQPTTNVESEEEQEQGGGEEDDDFNGFSDSFSGYDCQKFPLEMSPGDTVEAYRP